MYYFGLISDPHMDSSMHVLDTKCRKEFRKVTKVHPSEKKKTKKQKHEKSAKSV